MIWAWGHDILMLIKIAACLIFIHAYSQVQFIRRADGARRFNEMKDNYNKIEMKYELANLYLECNSIYEFLVQKDVVLLYAPKKLDVLACIVYDFKKNNKFMHDSIIAFFFLASLVSGMLISHFVVGLPILAGFLIGLCFFEIVGTVISIALFDMMHILEWHERGCPIEY